MSGYAEEAVLSRCMLEDGAVFLHKPFTADSLASKVRDALDRCAKRDRSDARV